MLSNELRAVWDEFEAKRWRAIQAVARLDADARKRPWKPGRWTPVQILEHLVITERWLLSSVDAAARGERLPRRINPKIVIFGLRKGFTVPAPDKSKPTADPDFEAVQAQWATVRETLYQRLMNGHDGDEFAANEVYGMLGAEQLLEIASAHLDYHQRQLTA